MTAAPQQLGAVLATSTRGRARLHQDGEEFVVLAPCPGCQEEQQHRSPVADGQPSAFSLSLACLLLCSRCTAADDELEQQRQNKEAISRRVSAADVPPSLVGLKFDDMLDGSSARRRTAIEIVREWSQTPTPAARPGLYLYGPVGVGKTRLAATAAWARLEHSPIRWVSVAVLIAKLSAAWGDADRREALKVLTGRGAIVLDDIDKSNPSEHVRNQLFPAIDQRVEARAPMIVTANSSVSQLAERLGDPIASRLAGHCTQLELDGPDRRLELPGVRS